MKERKEALLTRTIITNKCYCNGYDFSSGQPVLVEENEVVVYSTRKLNTKEIQRATEIKANPSLIYIVSNLTYEEEVRGISIKDFMDKSVAVERPKSQRKEN